MLQTRQTILAVPAVAHINSSNCVDQYNPGWRYTAATEGTDNSNPVPLPQAFRGNSVYVRSETCTRAHGNSLLLGLAASRLIG
jgi:hypothetical protein